MPSTYSEPSRASAGLADADLATVLDAWQAATERLQRTHQTLRLEVRRLTDELEAKNRELKRENRLADLGRIASHVAHEVRNSLLPLTLYTSALRRRLAGDAGGLDALGKIELALTALQAMVNDMLHFAADRQPRWQRFDLRRLIDEACQSLAPQLAAQDIALHIDAPEELALWGDPGMVQRALWNLALNALDAMPDGGGIWITVCETAGGVEVEVADNGPGVPSELKAKLFEPFFTTKSSGAGLGLAIVRRIAEAHGGDVLVRNCPDGGAAFTLRIPHSARRAAA